ncbi:MAG: copper oxidase [Gemmatimonadetes bacterium]|nr:copper oxidase [Gemmatimonadota bacterium]
MPRFRILVPLLAVAALTSCEYVRLLRPSVLKQLNPRVVRLVNELPRVDDPNEEVVARLFAHGGLDRAKVGADGVMRATVRAPKGEYIWYPAIIVMPRGGELELDFYNEDPFSYHAAFLPNVGNRHALFLPVGARGRARIRLDQPGMYWFGCPVANHVQRGMLGLILVSGEVPAEAKLDRPRQHRH